MRKKVFTNYLNEKKNAFTFIQPTLYSFIHESTSVVKLVF